MSKEKKLTRKEELEKVELLMKIANTFSLDMIRRIPMLIDLKYVSSLKKEENQE